MLDIASLAQFADLDVFWPTRRGWDVPEANLVAHLHAAAHNLGWRAYSEVPLEVQGQMGKRLDLLVVPQDHDEPVLWIEAKRIWSNVQADPIAADLQRLTDPTTALGRALPNRLVGRAARALFVALTHRETVADWWQNPAVAEPPFSHPTWPSTVAPVLNRALHRQVFAHPMGNLARRSS